eukprot:c46130_g1_i1.p1 GENE.c46130_g1_i1~~c46130_g1_i1.p1  ORF type:complete len:739 (+),score=187.33 c46130_g1_i1:79-2295(+)
MFWRCKSQPEEQPKSDIGIVISKPELENAHRLVAQLSSSSLQEKLKALDELLNLTKWTANRRTRNRTKMDENWRIYYIENGNRDLVHQAGLVKPLSNLLLSLANGTPENRPAETPLSPNATEKEVIDESDAVSTTDDKNDNWEKLLTSTLVCLSNLSREADDSRVASLIKARTIPNLATASVLEYANMVRSETEGGVDVRLHVSYILRGAMSAPNVGTEALRAARDASMLNSLYANVLINNVSSPKAQVEAAEALVLAFTLMDRERENGLRNAKWERQVMFSAVSLCQGGVTALQNASLRLLLLLVGHKHHAIDFASSDQFKVLGVMLHSHNPAVFKTKNATTLMDNGFLVCKVIATMCQHTEAYAALTASPSIFADMLGFLRSGLELNQLVTDVTTNGVPTHEIETALIVAKTRTQTAICCTGTAWLLSMALFFPDNKQVMGHLKSSAVREALKSNASHSDAFVYQFAARALGELGMFEDIPFYQPGNDEESIAEKGRKGKAVREWSENDVCDWVRGSKFAQYEGAFRSSWVDGDLLLSMTADDLKEIGVTNPIHCRFIVREVARMDDSQGDGSKTNLRQSTVLEDTTFKYDIFISYRRSTGTELAQLLKMHLEKMGFRVFLDIDCLGKGDFITHILSSLEASNVFLPVLTNGEEGRTVGYFDRCEGDTAVLDNVHKEIVHAVKQHKMIVPVFVTGYAWPDMTRLPEVCRAVTNHNAVEWIPQYHEAALEKLRRFIQ